MKYTWWSMSAASIVLLTSYASSLAQGAKQPTASATGAPTATAAPSQVLAIRPIFPLPPPPDKLPLREALFEIDPAVRGWIETQSEATSTAASINDMINGINGGKIKAKKDIIEKIYAKSARLVLFYHDPQKAANMSASDRQEKVVKYGKIVQVFGTRLAEISQGEQHANTLYQVHYTTSLMDPNSFDDQVVELVKIKDGLAVRLKKSVDLMLAITFTDSSMTINEGIDKINKNTGELRSNAQIAMGLCLARAMVGVSHTGDRITPEVNPAYLKVLEKTLAKAVILPVDTRGDVLSYTLWIWQQAQLAGAKQTPSGPKNIWANFNLDIERYHETPAGIAANERALIGKYFPTDIPGTIAGYKALRDSLKDSTSKLRVDMQLLTIEKSYYKQTGDYARFATSLKDLSTSYAAKTPAGVKPKTLTFFRKQLAAEEYGFYRSLLLTMAKADTPQQVRLWVQPQSTAYIARAKLTNEQLIGLKEALGKFYYQTQSFAQAADVYADLAKKNPTKYLPWEILAQAKLAGWPPIADFNLTKPDTVKNTHTQLIASYNLLIKTAGSKVDLQTLLQTGILKINQGNPTAGAVDLQNAVKLFPQAKESQLAAGWLLANELKNQDYKKFIEIATLVTTNKITAIDLTTNKPFDIETKLTMSLLAAGKGAIAKGKYNDAAGYLATLVNGHPKAVEHEEGYYLLAQSLYNSKKPKVAVKVLVSYCMKYPTSKRLEQALLTGATWSVQTKMPDYTITFYKSYLIAFKDSPNVSKVRNDLAKTYISKQYYDEAGKLYKEQVDDHKTTLDEKIAGAIAFMNIHEKYGDIKDGIWGAQTLLTLAGKNNPRFSGMAYGYLARNTIHNGDLKPLPDYEKNLVALDPKQPEVNEALGFVRFHLVKSTAKPVKFDEDPKSLQDPKKAIMDINTQFLAFKKQYDTICPKMIHNYCAPSSFELSTQASAAQGIISNIQLPSTLGENDLRAFSLFREQYIQQLDSIAKKQMSTAISLAKQGKVDEQWRTKILEQSAAH